MSMDNDLIIRKLDKIEKTLNEVQIAAKAVEVVLMGANKNNGLCSTVKDHGAQLKTLENWKAKVAGGVLVISSLIGWICKNIDKWW
jgi:coenzyme F420-reducing hydrogenase delta subunit